MLAQRVTASQQESKVRNDERDTEVERVLTNVAAVASPRGETSSWLMAVSAADDQHDLQRLPQVGGLKNNVDA